MKFFFLFLFCVPLLAQSQTCQSNNYAANKTAVASDGNDIAGNIVDGNLTTDWYGASDSKWIYVDLGASQNLCKATLKWGYWAGIPQTKVQGSNDASTWTDLYTIAASDHGTHAADNSYDYTDVDLSSVTTAYRYVRLYYASGSAWGPHLKEFEIYLATTIVYPDVTITNPTNGSSFAQGSNITLSASASLTGGSISKVEFFEGANKIGEDSTSPYSLVWSNVPAGSYAIVAHAHGSNGQTKISDAVNITVSSSSNWSLSGNSDTTSGKFLGTTNAQPLIIKTNGVERLRVNADGTIGIKTATVPTGADVAIGGNLYARKLKVTQDTWADFVFEKNYKIPTLEQLEAYINKHGHLPGVPSTSNVQNSGLDVGDNQALLLQKIEELTLYMIDLNKKVDKLTKENTALKKKVAGIKAKK
ncbi:MAG TPA: Ig-like domain-containing protein [Flavisolibacter sp.]|nr:Ig-like domain-containing protein [Flavisolibacter sp.]